MQAVALPASRRIDIAGWLVAQRTWIALAAILVIGFVVRVVDITHVPPGFFTDEAAAGLDAQAILQTGKDTHDATLPFFFESLGDFKLPVFIYTLVPFAGVLGLTEFSVRFTVAVLGTVTIATTFLLARELFRRDSLPAWRADLPALAAAGMLAIMPWHIHYSRTGFGEMVSFPLVFTLAWWLFLRAQRTGASLVPAALAFGLCFYTYRSGWVILPPFLLLLAVLYARDILARGRGALVALLAFAAVLLPLAEHLLSGGDSRAATASIFDVPHEQGVLDLFVDQYRSYFTASFLFEDGDNGFILRHYLPGHGVLYWFMLPLLIAGMLEALHRIVATIPWWRMRTVPASADSPSPKSERGPGDEVRPALLLLALVCLYPLGGALSDMSPISSRAILGSVVFALLAGLGVRALVDLVAAFRPRFLVPGALALAAAVTLAGAVSFATYLDRYFGDYRALSANYWGWQDGPQEIIQRFVALQEDYDELYLEGYFNAPHVFIPFYAGDSCPKCRIGDSSRYEPGKRQLFAFRIESTELKKVEFSVVDMLFYPDGEPSFVIVEILALR